MSVERGEPFLARWSRRKQAEPEAREREDVRVADALPVAPAGNPAAPAVDSRPVPADLPAPESLTPGSDFTRFMRADVPAASRNAALKTLFTDPHFNVMDGLDIYIDDYTKADPIPAAMLRDLAQSRMLHLFDDEEREAAPSPEAAAPGASDDEVAEVAQAAPLPEVAVPEAVPPETQEMRMPPAAPAVNNDTT